MLVLVQFGSHSDVMRRMAGRVAALYDIHGNAPALEAVLREMEGLGVDEIVIGGDVLPGPMPAECLALLDAVHLPMRFIMGNGDREVVAPSGAIPETYQSAMRWNAEQIGPEETRRIAEWPLSIRVAVEGIGDVLFCHATPRNDTEVFTKRTPEVRLVPIFGTLDVAIAVCGHTHMQFDRMVGSVRVINAGSVGMPFGSAGAFWLLIGPEVELRRTAYDLDAAAARVRETAFPGADAFAATSILQPPAEQTILDAFSHTELT